MSSHGGVDNNRSLIAKRGSGRDKHRKGHRGGGKTSTQTSGSGQGRSSHDDNSRGKRSQFLSREKKRVNLVNPMLGFGYDRNGSYITPKVSSITLASMMATEGFSESESEMIVHTSPISHTRLTGINVLRFRNFCCTKRR